MIFVCLGTKRFNFDRLLMQIDLLVEQGKIKENVIAQIGHSTYIPKNYKFKKFMSVEEYQKSVNDAHIIISHGGTGAIVKALKAHKQVIAVPRLAKYSEHSDDHQLQIVDFFEKNGYVAKVVQMEKLDLALKKLNENPITKRFKDKGTIVEIIDDYIIKTFND